LQLSEYQDEGIGCIWKKIRNYLISKSEFVEIIMFEQSITLHGRVVDAPVSKVIPREDGKTSTLVEFGLACDNKVVTGTNKEGKKIKTSFYQVQIWNEKMSAALQSSLTKGKMLPRRITGTSLKYQRKVAQAVKRARHLALMPYVSDMLK
jgi:ribosomal protein S18